MSWKILENEAAVLDLETGRYFTLNEVAAKAWELADGSRTISEIIDLILEEFEADRETIGEDVRILLEGLMEKSLVELSLAPFR